MKMKRVFFLGFSCLMLLIAISPGSAQEKNSDEKEKLEREKLIASSQTGGMPLFFNPNVPATPTINPSKFNNKEELYARKGLPNFFNKAKKGDSLVVGYIGGSITRGINLYRMQSARFIQNMFPNNNIKFINAGISGTGTDLGACRIQEQILQFKPDLIFIEFAVNNAFEDGMEGMIRQIWKDNPFVDICMIYTIFNGQSKIYAAGKVPSNIMALEAIADHYQIPSIHMGLEASYLESEGKLLWKAPSGTATDKIIFSNDGTHPVEAGGNLYAQSIFRSFIKMKAHKGVVKHNIPKAITADNWEDAKMFSPLDIAEFSDRWTIIKPKMVREFNQFADWFSYVMKAEAPGETFTFKFNGTMVGFFDIGGPEVGQLILEVDGKIASVEKQTGTLVLKANANNQSKDLINRFNGFCNNRYRGQAEFIELPPGIHIVKFIVSPEKVNKKQILGESQLQDIKSNPEKYDKTNVYIGKILIRGEVIN
ncbi:SGNH/GDSL hydrolase family protein [Pedobacter arcticus]|uniref:SGNH/GDSL hydrolase family protein n=1 Tax=Pedobacter arcticus TaxID=752140 RepID=UPI000377B8AE|nr:SGNH/GDSL hydrolase family protein [Pedobacter arcticus]